MDVGGTKTEFNKYLFFMFKKEIQNNNYNVLRAEYYFVLMSIPINGGLWGFR